MYNKGDRVRIMDYDSFSLFCPSLNLIPEEEVKLFAGQIVTIVFGKSCDSVAIEEDGNRWAWPTKCMELIEAMKDDD